MKCLPILFLQNLEVDFPTSHYDVDNDDDDDDYDDDDCYPYINPEISTSNSLSLLSVACLNIILSY